jgi:hypothetical protein
MWGAVQFLQRKSPSHMQVSWAAELLQDEQRSLESIIYYGSLDRISVISLHQAMSFFSTDQATLGEGWRRSGGFALYK